VHEYAEISSALKILQEIVPEIIILDVEDDLRSWRLLVAGLVSAQRRVRIVLMARRMGIDEAAEAKRLGVAGVILKPFREEEHVGRLVELMNDARSVKPRRQHVRYYPEAESQSMLTMPGPLSTLYRIVNVSLGGVCLAASKSGLRDLDGAGNEAPVRLSTGGIHLGVTCRVVHRSEELMGVQFLSMTSGRPDFLEHLGSLQSRVFGPRRVRGPW
jgi:DNA-binding response OmpR family regulator